MGTVPYGLISQAVVLSGESWSDKLDLSSLNTLLVLGTAFAVIVLIVILIFLIKIIPYHREVSQAGKSSPVDNVISQIAQHEEEELVSDNELVAVITAAIYASLGDAVPANGLIVRSIKKVGRKKRSNL